MNSIILAVVAIVIIATLTALLYFKEFLLVRETRNHAKDLGVALSKCTREVPTWKSHDFDRPPTLKKKTELGYCLKHSNRLTCQWSLLQRETQAESDFPPAWRLIVHQGKMPDALKQVLLKIAKERQNDYLEIVSDEENVCIYWKEWGGKVLANRIYTYLDDITKTNA